MPCVEPDDDFLYGKEFVGKVKSNEFTIEPTIAVPINIKHTSFPNSINLSGGGEITVGIYSTSDFDATLVKPETVVLKKSRLDATNEYCVELNKTEIRDLTETLCDLPAGDIGDCNIYAGDDMLLHLDVRCLPFTEADIGEWEVVLTGKTTDGKTFIGKDTLIVK